jgi:hypothetical protein
MVLLMVLLNLKINLGSIKMKKIALLFLFVGDHQKKGLWDELLTPVKDKFNLYVHAKQPLQDPFFKQFVIQEKVPTTWASHINAWRALMKEAYKNKENYKFVYLSDSCVPMYPLSKIYDKLVADSFGYMAHKKPWWNESRIPNTIPRQYHWGADERIILTRDHVQLALNDQEIYPRILGHHVDCESFPATLFKKLDILDQFRGGISYADWDHRENNGCSPFTFRRASELPLERWDKLRQTGYFFIRKIGREFPADYLKSLIHRSTDVQRWAQMD